MQITDAQKTEVRSFMADMWEFMKKYFNPEDGSSSIYWKSVIADARSIANKYEVTIGTDSKEQKGLLYANLINAFLAYLDKEAYEKSGQYPIKRWLNG